MNISGQASDIGNVYVQNVVVIVENQGAKGVAFSENDWNYHIAGPLRTKSCPTMYCSRTARYNWAEHKNLECKQVSPTQTDSTGDAVHLGDSTDRIQPRGFNSSGVV